MSTLIEKILKENEEMRDIIKKSNILNVNYSPNSNNTNNYYIINNITQIEGVNINAFGSENTSYINQNTIREVLQGNVNIKDALLDVMMMI